MNLFENQIFDLFVENQHVIQVTLFSSLEATYLLTVEGGAVSLLAAQVLTT